MRSKSEVIIANAMKVRGLMFRYKEMTDIGGYMKAPDFKIIHLVIHRIIYWEHCGMISDPEYLRDTFYKIRDYISQGIIPGVNLILTFDDTDGNIDSLMIERTLDLWFGPAEKISE